MYKLKLLNSKQEEIGEYKGTKIITEEILQNCLIVRFPFEFNEAELKDPNSILVRQTKDFIAKLVESKALDNKMLFVVPSNTEFMTLEEV